MVDSDTSGFTIEKLKEWKSDAETAAARALEHRQAPVTESEGVFLEAERLMPMLISEMRDDVQGDQSELIREILILPSPSVIFRSKKKRFVYYEDEHLDLQLQMDWLEEMGMVIDISRRDTPVYRMIPEFVHWLREPS